MRKRAALSLTLVTSLAGVALLAAPAHAEDTPVTIEIEGGEISISVPTEIVAATPITAGVDAQSVAFALGNVTVTDAAGGTLGWSVSAFASPFVSAASTIPATAGSYAAGAVTTTGTVTAATTDLTSLDEEATVVAGTASGVNTAIWNPTITVAIPQGALAGQYASTVTHSAL